MFKRLKQFISVLQLIRISRFLGSDVRLTFAAANQE